MTDEDVVRMVLSGKPVRDIVETIRSRDVRFDLSDEIVEELRLAGVTDPILDAMRERQAAVAPPGPPASPEPPARAPTVELRVRVVDETAGGRDAAIYFPDLMGDAAAAHLQVETGEENRRITDLALFVACTTPDHVPDHWRSESPLGRDFVSMPRHGMLAFRAGAKPIRGDEVPRRVRALFPDRPPDSGPKAETPRSAGWLRLDLSPELVAGVEPRSAHDLVFGVAALVGERYLLLVSDSQEGTILGGPLRIDLRVSHAKRTPVPLEVAVTPAPAGAHEPSGP